MSIHSVLNFRPRIHDSTKEISYSSLLSKSARSPLPNPCCRRIPAAGGWTPNWAIRADKTPSHPKPPRSTMQRSSTLRPTLVRRYRQSSKPRHLIHLSPSSPTWTTVVCWWWRDATVFDYDDTLTHSHPAVNNETFIHRAIIQSPRLTEVTVIHLQDFSSRVGFQL